VNWNAYWLVAIFAQGDHLLTSFPAPPSLRDQIVEGDTSIPYYPPSGAGRTARIRRSASITPEDSAIVGEPGRSRLSSPRRVRPTRSTRAGAHPGPRSQELSTNFSKRAWTSPGLRRPWSRSLPGTAKSWHPWGNLPPAILLVRRFSSLLPDSLHLQWRSDTASPDRRNGIIHSETKCMVWLWGYRHVG
jgi:hypothetical protein